MQDLLPLGVDDNLRKLLKVSDSIVGPHAEVDAIQIKGPHTILIAGTVQNVMASDGVVVLAAGGRVTGGIRSRMLIVLGRIEPDPEYEVKAKLVCEHIVTGSGSVIIDTDIRYSQMVSHQKAIMRRVSLDQLESSACVTSN